MPSIGTKDPKQQKMSKKKYPPIEAVPLSLAALSSRACQLPHRGGAHAPSLPCPCSFFFLSCSLSVKLKHQGSQTARRHWLAPQWADAEIPPCLTSNPGYNRQWTGPVSGWARPGRRSQHTRDRGQPAASLESLLRNARFVSPIGPWRHQKVGWAPRVECGPCRGREATPLTTYTAEPRRWWVQQRVSQSGVSAQSVDERTAGGGGSGRLLEQVN